MSIGRHKNILAIYACTCTALPRNLAKINKNKFFYFFEMNICCRRTSPFFLPLGERFICCCCVLSEFYKCSVCPHRMWIESVQYVYKQSKEQYNNEIGLVPRTFCSSLRCYHMEFFVVFFYIAFCLHLLWMVAFAACRSLAFVFSPLL